MTPEHPPSLISTQRWPQRQQGVLWKRRDVFKNKWRPRWFVLQEDEAVLTYYLLSKINSTSPTTISTPLRRPNGSNCTIARTNGLTDPPSVLQEVNPLVHSTLSQLTTEIANVADNPVDYDVVPRGAIYLAGCTVSNNDKLSITQGLFVFTIVPPNSEETACHLAARTLEARAAWVATLSAVCKNGVAENGNNYATVNGETPTSESSWQSVSPLAELFGNVPDPLAARLEQSLESNLELCEDVSPSLRWVPIFQNRDGVSAFQRQDLQGRVTMKSTAMVPHHPKQLLNLLLDTGRRQDYETNLAMSKRLDVLSHHTFLDYYASKAVWPTSPRDFAVVLHWQTLRRQRSDGETEEALVLLAFSCPEAENLKGPIPPYVRASLHASFYLLRLIPPPMISDPPAAKCHVTRILCYDHGGPLPTNLAKTILMQQAGMPGILSKHLKSVEPMPEARLSINEDGLLDNHSVIRDVVEKIIQLDKAEMVSSARQKLNFDKNSHENSTTDSPGDANKQQEVPRELSIHTSAMILLLPLLLYHSIATLSLSIVSEVYDFWLFHPAIMFLIAAFVAIRIVVVLSLGQGLPNSAALRSYQGGPITCNINVDLKGVLRFIRVYEEEELAAKKNQSAAGARPQASTVHIIATALARAMLNHAACWNYRRVTFPFLLVDGFFRYPCFRLDLLLLLASGRLICLKDFACDNVQAVTNAMLGPEQGNPEDKLMTVQGILSSLCAFMNVEHRHGKCLIVMTKTDTNDDYQVCNSIDTGGVAVTSANVQSDIDVLVVVGGVRLQRTNVSMGSPLRASPPKPMLSLSLTINTTFMLDTSKCHAFAEDLARLIQCPELCDD